MTTTTPPPPPSPPPAAAPPSPPPPPPPPSSSSPRPTSPSGRSPSRRAVAGWKVVASFVAVVALVWGVSQVVTQLAHEERTTVTDHAADGIRALDVRVDNGSVTLVGTSGDTIRVTARISDGLRETGESQTVVDDVLELRGDCPVLLSTFCDVSYTVELPAGTDVVARTDNDDIEVDGVLGAIDASTSNGRVEVRGSGTGPLRLGTDNGRVVGSDLRSSSVEASSDNGSVELTFRDAPDDVRARTDNGSVRVLLPDDGKSYAIDVGTDNGSASAPIRTDPGAARTITARSDNGSVLVAYTPR